MNNMYLESDLEDEDIEFVSKRKLHTFREEVRKTQKELENKLTMCETPFFNSEDGSSELIILGTSDNSHESGSEWVSLRYAIDKSLREEEMILRLDYTQDGIAGNTDEKEFFKYDEIKSEDIIDFATKNISEI